MRTFDRPRARMPGRALAVVVAAGLLAGACGGGNGDGDAGSSTDRPVDQTVEMGMVDLAFEPTSVTVKAGASVRFVFRNEGSVVHEALFGDEATQQALGNGKAKRVGVEVGPGQTKAFVRTFQQPGPLLIGCHLPGHYQAGMKARLTVE